MDALPGGLTLSVIWGFGGRMESGLATMALGRGEWMDWMDNPANDSTIQLSLKSDVVSILSISFAKSTLVIVDILRSFRPQVIASRNIDDDRADWFRGSI
mmetsp:Transcript_126746/g.364555  ORF Transcript_126746/g.364555 Transcript_126746/m.364555 type:complete len:100 (+) Transcript_126746:139-438(+)